MRRSLCVVLFLSGCGGKGMPPAYPVETFLKNANDKDTCDPATYRGVLPSGLQIADRSAEGLRIAVSACSKADTGTEPFPTRLEFDSLESGNICFRYGAADTQFPDLEQLQKIMTMIPVWVIATASLDTLKGPTNKAPPGAATKWTVTQTDGAVIDRTKTEDVKIDPNTTVTIKTRETGTMWEIKMCAAGFTLPPDARHLVVVSPQQMYGSNYQPPERNAMTPDDDVDAYRENFPWSAASVMVWDILQPVSAE